VQPFDVATPVVLYCLEQAKHILSKRKNPSLKLHALHPTIVDPVGRVIVSQFSQLLPILTNPEGQSHLPVLLIQTSPFLQPHPYMEANPLPLGTREQS